MEHISDVLPRASNGYFDIFFLQDSNLGIQICLISELQFAVNMRARKNFATFAERARDVFQF